MTLQLFYEPLFYQIVEGYGQTECTAPVTLTVQGDHVPEHVGPPVACCKVKVSSSLLRVKILIL